MIRAGQGWSGLVGSGLGAGGAGRTGLSMGLTLVGLLQPTKH